MREHEVGGRKQWRRWYRRNAGIPRRVPRQGWHLVPRRGPRRPVHAPSAASLACVLVLAGIPSPAQGQGQARIEAQGQHQSQSQEAEVATAVAATLAAWTAGDFDSFAMHYHDDVRGFFIDGVPLALGFDHAALRVAYDAGLRTSMTIRDLDTRVYDGAAVSTAYLDASITLPGVEKPVSGTWRYSETRISDAGEWKVVQYHFSRLAEGM